MRLGILLITALLTAACLAPSGAAAMEETAGPPPRLLYHPSICDGVIAFSCFGDIWTVREDGSALRRITDHPGRDVHPALSPDGKMIAFTSDRTGPYNVFVIPVAGGEAKQLTWNSLSDVPVTWTPDGTKIVFRGPPRDSWDRWLYTVPAEGGMREPLPVGQAAFGTFSRDGRYFVFNRKGIWDPWRKGYLGSADSDVWVADLETGTFEKRTEFRGPDSWPLFAPNGDIYFVSERDGPKNLYRLPHRGGEPQQITHHEGPGVVNPDISPDGKTIVYQHNFSIWMVSTRGGKPKQVPIVIVGEPKQDLTEWTSHYSRADQFAVRPDGKRIAVSCHGQLFTVPTGKAGDKVRVTNDSARNRVPVYSPDGTKLAYMSDSPAGERICVYDRKTKEVTEIEPPAALMAVDLWTWNHNRMAFRPDSKALAFHAGHGLYVYDLETKETKLITETTERAIEPSAWSPDGRWLAYSKLDSELMRPHLFVYSFDTGEERQLYDDPFGEWRPVFTPDGKYLVFYAEHELDSGEMYDRTGRSWVVEEVYALALQKEIADPDEPPDPDAEEVDEAKDDDDEDDDDGDDDNNGDDEDDDDEDEDDDDENDNGDNGDEDNEGDDENGDNGGDDQDVQANGEEAAEEADAAEAEKAEDEEEGVKVEIDFENVEMRTRRITQMVEPIWSWLLVTPDSKRVIFGVNEPRGNRSVPVIYSALIERTRDPKENLKEVAQLGWGSMQLAEDGKTLFVLDGGAVKKVPVGGGKVETIEFALSFPVNLRDEMRQMYFEAWRALRDGFYDETMHGVDWVAARQKYEPFLDSVSDKQEVMDLIIEMIGELNASHCGAWVGRGNQSWTNEESRRLGIELEPDDESGLYRVTRIYEKGPADKSWLDLQVGDYVFAIEGHDVRAGEDYDRFLIRPLNEKVTLRVGREADPAAARDIRVGHVSPGEERTLWYESWVRRNERYVEEKTDGRVGYLHIQGMNSRSLVKFKKDLTRLRNYEGLIVDVRHNGGGLIDDVLIDILNRRPYNITRSRGASLKRKRPEEAFYGAKAVLMDSFSFSNAEMFPDAFRLLGHGKLVGEPTAGGVIGTGAYWLIDGSVVRMPTWGIWSITGQNLENYGVPPDILVEHTPDEDVNGADMQLDAAIEHVLSEIEGKTQ